jgi:hypothetical protein
MSSGVYSQGRQSVELKNEKEDKRLTSHLGLFVATAVPAAGAALDYTALNANCQ